MSAENRLSYDDYTVGWICALPLELAAAKAMLDEIHPKLPQDPNDHNTYFLGSVNGHNVVIACLPAGVYGTTSTSTVAASMLFTFRAIRFGLMVGIGGGVPSNEADIRLGDVVVSLPTGTSGGVIQYDYGRTVSGGQFKRTGMLNKPPNVLLTAVSNLQADHMLGDSQIPAFLSQMVAKYPIMSQFLYCGQQYDRLFESNYDHVGSGKTCDDCDQGKLINRDPRTSENPQIHYGLIASGNQVMKHGATRDLLGRDLGIRCFEMEAAGLMDHFPCLVIRGICDYSDSHKNDQWQKYAAATAAAYAKELLSVISVRHIWKTTTAARALSQVENLGLSTHGQTIHHEPEYSSEIVFELYEDSGAEARLICPRSIIHPNFTSNRPSETDRAFFVCQCAVSLPGETSHSSEVAALAPSPLCVCIRMAGHERILMLYQASDRTTGAPKSLLIKKIERSAMADIEKILLDTFTFNQTKLMFRQNIGNFICFTTTTGSGSTRAHILNLIGDTRSFKGKVKSVTFNRISEQLYYEREHIESIQMLHYRTTSIDRIFESRDVPYSSFQFVDSAEIILYYAASLENMEVDTTHTTLHLLSDTKVRSDTSQAALIFEKIDCTGYTARGEPESSIGIQVTIRFTDIASSLHFQQKMEDMRMELFVIALQYPRAVERGLWRMKTSEIHTDRLHIADSEISIVQNTGTSRFRLIICSTDGYSIISQELSEDFFELLSADGSLKFDSPTYVVQFDRSGKRSVVSYRRGFTFARFSDTEAERRFLQGLTTIARRAHGSLDSNISNASVG